MRAIRLWFLAQVVLSALCLATAAFPQPLGAEQRVKVAASFTVIADLVRAVGGDRVAVASLAPVGAEVHEWELRPHNFRELARAEAVFYNGYGLEQWLRQVGAAVSDEVELVALAENCGHPTKPISIGELEGEPDPHMWMDPRAVKGYIEVIYQILAELDPAGEGHYRARADDYRAKLEQLHAAIQTMFAAVPEDQRILITSEAALPYFAQAYDFRHAGIWGNNAEEEGAPRHIMRIVDLVNEWQPAAIFWESTITDRYVTSVATDTGTKVAGPLYVDSLGEPDSQAGNYISMMRHNARLIVSALGGD